MPPSDRTLSPDDARADTVAAPITAPTASGGNVDLSATALDDHGFAARYEIGALLGQGGMGEVRLCRDGRIGRRVAVKRVLAGGGSSAPATRARFVREARIQGQLEHPAVVPVYDLGRTPDGAEFFTMKRVRGRTLQEILDDAARGGEFSRRKLLTAFSSVCLAVHYAHTRGVLHRDLKPANLMLGDFGEVYLLDWGLAKVEGEPAVPEDKIEAVDGAGQTLAGAVFGTPGFAAPEVLDGRPADARADVYALGAILFEILTLEPLHPGRGPTDLIASTKAGADARATLRAPGGDVPPELEALCVRATALRPDDRPATARELSETVERFLDGDRDQELRRAQARRHAEAASTAADRALAGELPVLADRQRALQEVGRALALDPDNRAAAATLVRLLTTPPREVPPEAARDIEHAEADGLRSASRVGSVIYVCCALSAPLVVASGIRSYPTFFTAFTLFVASAIYSRWLASAKSFNLLKLLMMVVISTAAIGAIAPLFGPYLFLPCAIATNTMAFAWHGRALRWELATVVGALGFLGPALLEWAGLIPVSTQFTDAFIQVVPRGIAFSATWTRPLLLVFSTLIIFGAAGYAALYQRALADAQRRLHLQAWQLRQLVAEGSK
jgi:eukaryotic-like serine/threonine-protein kinase